MIPYSTRDVWTDSLVESVTFKPTVGWVEYFDPPRPQQAHVQNFNVYPIRVYFEAYTPNSGPPSNRMKHFEHFVRRINNASYRSSGWAKRSLGGAIPHPTKQWGYGDSFGYPKWNGYPYYKGVHKDPYFGWLPGVFSMGDPSDPSLGLDQWYSPGVSSVTAFTPLTDSWNNLIAAGLRASVPKIRSELSLLNSVYELKDMRTMASTLRGLYRTVQNIVRAWNPSLRRASRTASDVYLQQEFNLKPLFSDIQAIKRSMRSAVNQFDRLLGRNARPSTFHWTTTVREAKDREYTEETRSLASYSQLIYPTLVGHVRISRETITQPAVFCFTIQYTPYWSDVQQKCRTVLALLDSLGVNFNPSIVWNAIPWSFVVDWFVKIGNLLDQFEGSWTEPLMIVHQCCASLRRRRVINCGLRHGVYLPASVEQSATIVPVVSEESYIRIPVRPSYSSLEVSGLSSKEFMLGTALALSRKRNRVHSRG